jgi:3-deoxy-D-manno-octulosonic-acid transferase
MLVFQFYRSILAPLAQWLLFRFGFLGGTKIQQFILDRKSLDFSRLPHQAVWIHASSGEIEYAKSLIRLISKNHKVVVSYFSPSAKKLLESISCDGVFALPLDTKDNVQELLEKLKPKTLILSRSDLWPELIWQCRKRKIPTALIAAGFASKSAKKARSQLWLKFFSLKSFVLNNLSQIHCVHENDLEFLKTLKVSTNSFVVGDPRLDQIDYRLENPKRVKSFLNPNRRTFILGSTWPQDEAVVFNLKFFKEIQWSVIIAPHDTSKSRVEEVVKNIRAQGMEPLLYSKAEMKDAQWSLQNKVLIVDTVGVLQEIYGWGTLAFVGGSFKKRVHNVMEPLMSGLFVLVGPKNQNSFEVQCFRKVLLEKTPLVREVLNFNDVEKAVRALPLDLSKDLMRSQLEPYKKASDKILTHLNSLF